VPRLELISKGRRGSPSVAAFFEAEQRGTSVFYASGNTDEAPRERKTEHASEDEAYAAMARALVAKRRAGYVAAGRSRAISGVEAPRSGSALLIDVYFAAGDERFLDEVLCFDGAKKLAALAKPWFEDPRPFARRTLLRYIDDGCARPEHKALVKRLFKLAEAARDTELMGHFLVAFDRWTRRVVAHSGGTYDFQTQRWQPKKVLRADPLVRERLSENESAPEFTRVTRRYLARRVFRYFRRLGYQDASAYRKAVLPALARYRDEHLASVGQFLSAWGLLHVLYGRSPVLDRRPKGILIKAGRTLAELEPEPMFTAAWDDAFDDVSNLLVSAQSRPVRSWALAILRARYAQKLAELGLSQVKALVLSPHEEAQMLGVELFSRLNGLERASLDDWLELLGAENLEVLAAVCERASGVVSGARLTLAQCVDLALSPAAPLAALGLGWLKEKRVTSEADLAQCLRLCAAKVASVRVEAARYSAELLRTLPFVRPEHVRELCDAQSVEVRGHGLLVVADRFSDDSGLWAALCESPYPDVRKFVIAHAERFRGQPPATLAHALGSALCALFGAATDKRRAAHEIAVRVGERPAEAPSLLPLLSVALRSVHPAERSLALGTLAKVAHRQAPLAELLRDRFPELRVGTLVSE